LISTGNQQLAVNAGTVELVTTQGLGAHAEHAPTAAAAAALLCALLRKHGGAVEAAMEVGFDDALPACIRMHPENEEVQIAGCMAVFSACWDNDAVQDALREAGVVELLLEAMGRYRSSGRLLAMACAALSNMCDSPETEAYWLAQGGLEAVIAALAALPSEQMVQEEGCRAICNVAYNLGNQGALLGARAHEPVLAAMRAYAGESVIQEIGTCFIGNLTTDHDEAKQLLGAAALGPVLAALRGHRDVVDVQEEAWRALIGLVQEKANRGLAVAEGALEVVAEAMAATEDAGILRFGSLVLLQLVKDNEMRRPVVELGVVPVLEAGMAQFPGDEALNEIGAKLVKKLVKAK